MTRRCIRKPSNGRNKENKGDTKYDWMEIGPKSVITVRKEDYDVFQALDMDSFVVDKSRKRYSSITDDPEETSSDKQHSLQEANEYGQKIPTYSKKEYDSKSPPILPPHLVHYMLNKKPVRGQFSGADCRRAASEYPAINYEFLLPKPCHTLLNHLYAMAMKEGVMTLSTTQRYRKKYVTTVFYRPS